MPKELEEKRKPLVDLEELRRLQSQKVKDDLLIADELLQKSLVRDVPEMRIIEDKEKKIDGMKIILMKSCEEYEEEYGKVKEELMMRMKERPYLMNFNWKKAMDAGEKRLKSAKRKGIRD